MGAVRIVRLFLGLLVLLGTLSVRAERFLSVEEAQKLCFAEAERFEPRTFRFTSKQVNAIEFATKQRVLNRGNRTWLAWQGTNLLGVLVVDHVLGKHEVIDYAVAIGPEGAVQRLEILEYRESHGGQIRGVNWRDQFKGRTSNAPLRLNEDIYNISGATISCRNVTEGVRRVLATYKLVIRPDLDAAAGLDPQRVPDANAPKR